MVKFERNIKEAKCLSGGWNDMEGWKDMGMSEGQQDVLQQEQIASSSIGKKKSERWIDERWHAEHSL